MAEDGSKKGTLPKKHGFSSCLFSFCISWNDRIGHSMRSWSDNNGMDMGLKSYHIKFLINNKIYKKMERLREQTGVSLQKQANAALAFFLENVTIGEGVNFGKKLYVKRINCYRKPIEVVPSVDAEYAEYMRNLNPEGKKKDGRF